MHSHAHLLTLALVATPALGHFGGGPQGAAGFPPCPESPKFGNGQGPFPWNHPAPAVGLPSPSSSSPPKAILVSSTAIVLSTLTRVLPPPTPQPAASPSEFQAVQVAPSAASAFRNFTPAVAATTLATAVVTLDCQAMVATAFQPSQPTLNVELSSAIASLVRAESSHLESPCAMSNALPTTVLSAFSAWATAEIAWFSANGAAVTSVRQSCPVVAGLENQLHITVADKLAACVPATPVGFAPVVPTAAANFSTGQLVVQTAAAARGTTAMGLISVAAAAGVCFFLGF